MKINLRLSRVGLCFLLAGSLSTGCSYLPKGRADFEVRVKEQGIASWYGDSFHGQATANGEIYNETALTGAHRTLPFGTMVKVTNAMNGLQVKVRINDRGPYVGGRILDMSYAAAEELDLITNGIAPVNLEVISVEREPLIGFQKTWRALSGLMRKIDLSERGDVDLIPLHPPILPLLANPDAMAMYPRRMSPWDIALERRLRREPDSKASDSGEEGNSETELG